MALKDYEKFIGYSFVTQEEKDNWAFIDQIDFRPYFAKKIENIYDFRRFVEAQFVAEGNVLPEYLDGELFNWINGPELADYLRNRYPDVILRIREACYDTYMQDYDYFFIYR